MGIDLCKRTFELLCPKFEEQLCHTFVEYRPRFPIKENNNCQLTSHEDKFISDSQNQSCLLATVTQCLVREGFFTLESFSPCQLH